MPILPAFLACVWVVWAAGLLAGSSALYPILRQDRRMDNQINGRSLGHIWGTQGSFSCGQLLVGNSAANGCDHKAIEPLEGVKLHVSIIEPERKLIHVTPKMLFAGVMIDTANTAFQHRPDAFYRVSVSKALSVLSGRVVDGFVSKEQPANAAIRLVFVGAKHRANDHVIVNSLLNGRQIGSGNRHRFRATATLTHTENALLANGSPSEHKPFVRVFRGLLTANVGFINLDNALQFVDVVPASLAEPLEHKPRRFLRNAYLFAQLKRRDAFTSRNKQIHRIYPLVKRHMRPLKDRARSHGEIQRASVTAIEAVLSDSDTFAELASWTDNAIRPESGFEINPSSFLVGNEFKQLKGRYGAFAHRPNLAKWSKGVKYIIPHENSSGREAGFEDAAAGCGALFGLRVGWAGGEQGRDAVAVL